MVRRQIRETYAKLRQSLVEHGQEYKCVPGFYDVVVNKELRCSATEDQDLMKLAVMSSLNEWEGALYIIPNGQRELLHYLCLELVMDGEDFFGISSDELAMLREDILSGSDDYARLLTNLAEIETQLSGGETLDLLIQRAQAAMKLFRHKEMKDSLDRMKAYSSDPYCGIHIAVWTALLYAKVVFASNLIPIDETSRLREAVALFAQSHEHNRNTGCYDPVVYTDLWIHTINYYIFYLDCESSMEDFESPLPPTTASQEMFLGVTPEFLTHAEPEILELMKKHDELILENIICCIDERKYQPFLKRTEQCRQRMFLEGHFHSKMEHILKNQPRFVFKTPYDLTPAKVNLLLDAEFSSWDCPRQTPKKTRDPIIN